MNNERAKICIVTQSHLCRNPRVLKEAIALASEGYRIQIFTCVIATDLYRQDIEAITHFPNISLHIISDLSKNTLASFTDKVLNKTGRFLKRYFGLESGLALGYGAIRYYKNVKAANANLYICHQELATYIGIRLLKIGCKVGFDFEDWYSEDLLPEARAERPLKLLRKAESTALNKGTFCITTSNAMAKKLAAVYGSPLPQVIYNVFPSPPADVVKNLKPFLTPLKLFWFSQTIGKGRGLEQFIVLTARFKTQIEIHLLGNVSETYRETLSALLPGQHQLYFHKMVNEHELAAKIALFDIGLALELDTPPSRNLTVTNKFFQYLQSGLPVIASETSGQTEVFSTFTPGYKIAQQPDEEAITALAQWLDKPDQLQAARQRALEAASVYNWENESKKLIAIVNNAIEN